MRCYRHQESRAIAAVFFVMAATTYKRFRMVPPREVITLADGGEFRIPRLLDNL